MIVDKKINLVELVSPDEMDTYAETEGVNRELPSGQLFIEDDSDTFLHQHLTVDEAKDVAQHCGLHCEVCEANPELNATGSDIECNMYCVVERDQLEKGLHKVIKAIAYSHFVLGRRGTEVKA